MIQQKSQEGIFCTIPTKTVTTWVCENASLPAVASEFVDVVINIQLPNIQATFSDDRRTENPGEVRPAKILKSDFC